MNRISHILTVAAVWGLAVPLGFCMALGLSVWFADEGGPAVKIG